MPDGLPDLKIEWPQLVIEILKISIDFTENMYEFFAREISSLIDSYYQEWIICGSIYLIYILHLLWSLPSS